MTEPITINGAQKLQDELNDLVNNKRQQVIQAIAEAREHGDLKENAEYHAAKEEQSLLETKIAKLKNVVASARTVSYTHLTLPTIYSV